MSEHASQARPLHVEGDEEAVNSLYLERGWTDGLPIVAPTPERVRAMVEASGRKASEIIAEIPPRYNVATVETIAINAVMAGCRPDYMPVVIAVVQAATEDAFNLHGIQMTTSPVTPLIVVNGPIVKRIGMNSGPGVFGPGWRANATIGRALRLIMLNVGAGTPGVMDRSAQGQPGKYTLCIAENEAASPWEPLHVEQGYRTDESVVTLFGASQVISACDHTSQSAESMVNVLGGSMVHAGLNAPYFGGAALFVLCPEHANILAKGGFTKQTLREALFARAKLPRAPMNVSPDWLRLTRSHRPAQFADESKDFDVYVRPDDIHLVVAGGGGPHSSFAPNWSDAVNPVSRVIAVPD